MARNHGRVWVGKNCVLCGGNRPAETCEHAPPKILFLDQPRPKKWEFPACERCNNGLSQHDQLVAYIAYSQAPEAVTQASPLTSSQRKLINGFANNSSFPYRSAQSVPVYDKSTQTWTAARDVELTEATKKAAFWSAKQSLAMWYEHTQTIASQKTIIDIGLLTNSMTPDHELEQAIHKLGPTSSLSTAKNTVGKNFSYKFRINSEQNLAAMFAQYHGGFAFVSIVTDRPTAKLSHRRLQFKFATNAYRGIHEVKARQF